MELSSCMVKPDPGKLIRCLETIQRRFVSFSLLPMVLAKKQLIGNDLLVVEEPRVSRERTPVELSPKDETLTQRREARQ